MKRTPEEMSVHTTSVCTLHDEPRIQKLLRGEPNGSYCRSCQRDRWRRITGSKLTGPAVPFTENVQHLRDYTYPDSWYSSVLRAARKRGLRQARERIDAQRAERRSLGFKQSAEVCAELDLIAARVASTIERT